MRGRLHTNPEFMCTACKDREFGVGDFEEVTVNCGGRPLEVVDKFCYLGDTIGARGGAEDSITARIRSGWNKFRDSGATVS